MSEGKGGEGVSLVVLRTASQPSLRSELESLREVLRVDHEVPGEAGDNGPPWDLVAAERNVVRDCSGKADNSRSQSHTLLETGSQILHPLQLRLSDVPVLYHGPDLLVEQLLLERIVGEVQEEEGHGGAGGVNPGRDGVLGHDQRDLGPRPTSPDHPLEDAQLVIFPLRLLPVVLHRPVHVLLGDLEDGDEGPVPPPDARGGDVLPYRKTKNHIIHIGAQEHIDRLDESPAL